MPHTLSARPDLWSPHAAENLAMMSAEIKKQDFAQTLARGLACLEVLASASSPVTVTEVANAMDVHRASARRILLTLANLGYVQEERGHYVSAPKVLSLGRGILGKTSVWTAVMPEVVALADRFSEPCSISVLEGLDIVFVARDSTRRIYTSRLGVGDHLPAHCSATGKMLLASLDDDVFDERLKGVKLQRHGPESITKLSALRAAVAQIRIDGYAMAINEMEDGTLSIGVPLHERGGKIVAAMSVASHRSRMSPNDLKVKVLPKLHDAAKRVEGVLRDFQDRNRAIFAQ
jgi:IclR family pca regulon transcriptional regulator